jgi:hypothetical protein
MAQRRLYIALLPLLGATAQQNDEHLAVPAEIDSIAGPRLIRSSETPSPSDFTFEVLPWRSTDIVTQAAACSSRPPNQRLKGLISSSVMNSSI